MSILSNDVQFLNASVPNLFNWAGSWICARFSQLLKAPLPSSFNWDGSWTCFRFLQLQNAYAPINVSFSGSWIFLSPVSKNAYFSISVTESGNTIELNALQPLNAPSLIFSNTVFSNITLSRLLHFSKALSPMDCTPFFNVTFFSPAHFPNISLGTSTAPDITTLSIFGTS